MQKKQGERERQEKEKKIKQKRGKKKERERETDIQTDIQAERERKRRAGRIETQYQVSTKHWRYSRPRNILSSTSQGRHRCIIELRRHGVRREAGRPMLGAGLSPCGMNTWGYSYDIPVGRENARVGGLSPTRLHAY